MTASGEAGGGAGASASRIVFPRLGPESLKVYDSVFSGDQASLIDKYSAEDRYVGSLVGASYAEAFKARSPPLVDTPEVFLARLVISKEERRWKMC